MSRSLRGTPRSASYACRSRSSTEVNTFARKLDELSGDLWEPLTAALQPEADGERRPLFLYLHPFDPHAPYFEHEELGEVLPPLESPDFAPEGWHAEQLIAAGIDAPPQDPGWADEQEEMREQRGFYDQEVLWSDQMLAALFNRLANEGVLENAVVALVSDHGEGLWEHVRPYQESKRPNRPREFFYQEHGFDLHEEQLRTPFLLWGAGVPAGVRVEEAVENVDLFPTLYELAGVVPPPGLHGQSLVPLLNGEANWAPKERVYSYALVGGMVREPLSGLKLIAPTYYEHELRDTPVQLYDVRADEHERRDLLAERPQDAARLFAHLERWRRQHPTRGSVTTAAERNPDMGDLGYGEEHSARGDEDFVAP